MAISFSKVSLCVDFEHHCGVEITDDELDSAACHLAQLTHARFAKGSADLVALRSFGVEEIKRILGVDCEVEVISSAPFSDILAEY